MYTQAFKLRVHAPKIIFLFLNQNICCWYSKEMSQWDEFFWAPKTDVKTDG